MEKVQQTIRAPRGNWVQTNKEWFFQEAALPNVMKQFSILSMLKNQKN